MCRAAGQGAKEEGFTCEPSGPAGTKTGWQTGPQAEAESAAVARDMRASSSDMATTALFHRDCSPANCFTSPCRAKGEVVFRINSKSRPHFDAPWLTGRREKGAEVALSIPLFVVPSQEQSASAKDDLAITHRLCVRMSTLLALQRF